MKSYVFYQVIMVICTFHSCRTQRRIKDGHPITSPQRFMAYLVKAPVSPQQYDAWLCGGSIVTSQLIVTSAACVQDIQYMYAVAGYNKYVPAHRIKEDECTKGAKKKVVFSCVPETYDFAYDKLEKWSNIDIGVVMVESPYDFSAKNPLPGCTWVPNIIEVNYNEKYQEPGKDATVMGWGHRDKYRKIEDTKDHNEEILLSAPVVIQDKVECKKSYESFPNVLPIIDKYMICTNGSGNIDSEGNLILKGEADKEGCDDDVGTTNSVAPSIAQPTRIARNYYRYQSYYRRNGSEPLKSDSLRRNGICQNDHGGPIIGWVGANQFLLGVSSVFLVNPKDYSCGGPYLYTSTFCNSKFLGCVLNLTNAADKKAAGRAGRECTGEDCYLSKSDPEEKRREEIFTRYGVWFTKNRRFCSLPPQERGFDMIQRRISWAEHPDGPAKNELSDDMIERPQIPLHMLRSFSYN